MSQSTGVLGQVDVHSAIRRIELALAEQAQGDDGGAGGALEDVGGTARPAVQQAETRNAANSAGSSATEAGGEASQKATEPSEIAFEGMLGLFSREALLIRSL
jgi:hypothetical protein